MNNRKRLSTVRIKDTTTSVRLVRADRQLLISAAIQEGVSICEFLRRSMRERSVKILNPPEARAEDGVAR